MGELTQVSGTRHQARERRRRDVEPTQQVRIPGQRAEVQELRPGGGRDVGPGVAAIEPGGQPRVDSSQPQRAAIGGCPDASVVLE
jgi:hypothetical protein